MNERIAMTFASDLSLPTLPVDSMAFSANPYPQVEAARQAHPWLARIPAGYIVHNYQAVADLLGDDDNLLPGFGPVVDFYDVHGTMWARFWDEMLLSISGEKHKRLRASVAHAFTPRHANQVRPLMRQVITELLDEWAPKGEFDFTEFAAWFPVSVMCGLLGVSTEPIPRIRSALETHIGALTLDPALREPALAGWEVMWRFADDTVNQREASGAFDEDSLLDTLIASKNAGGMDETELRFMLLVLVLAGYDTSKNMLGLIMKMMVERPEMYARCAEDKAFCGKVVDEALRYYGIATPYRVAARDFSYQGVEFRKGDVIVCATALSGHDPEVFPDPSVFDPSRQNAARHVTFGRGAHMCLGQFIAKAQLQEGLHLITQRLKRPRVTGAIEWKPFIGAWGLTSLPLVFEPGEAA
jgi:cytochrome P450